MCEYGWMDEKLPYGMRRAMEYPVYLWSIAQGREIKMLYIPPGEFVMGTDDEAMDEKPRHIRNLEYGFWIARTPITWNEFRLFINATACVEPPHPPWKIQNDLPVTNVTWFEAKDFCKWSGLNLPTEEEWEKSARGDSGNIFPWGNELPNLKRCVWRKHPKYGRISPALVGNFPDGASPYGVLDMAGNVWEWCADYYDPYAYTKGNGSSTVKEARVYRGGGFRSTKKSCRTTKRAAHLPNERHIGLGFRPVKISKYDLNPARTY